MITQNVKVPKKLKCEKCGFVSSNKLCKACILLETLNKGKPKMKLEIQDWKYFNLTK